MSRSPLELPESNESTDYRDSWRTINRLLRTGSSFSGYERNCCFLNFGRGTFANVSAATGFDLIDDGRGLALVDWDFDGDLDLWTTNRTGPSVRFLRNDIAANHFLAVRLRGTESNRDAIGARLELYAQVDDGPQIKTLRAGEGFLSQSSKWIVFGLGATQTIDRLVVRWPSGAVQSISDLKADRHYNITESRPTIEWVPPANDQVIGPSPPKTSIDSDHSRVVLLRRPPLPAIDLTRLDGSPIRVPLAGRPVVLNVWATWCRPCLAEMEEWSASAELIRDSGIDVVSVCVDERSDDGPSLDDHVRQVTAQLSFPFTVAFPTGQLVQVLDAVQRTYIPLQQSLPVPASFLVDSQGQLAVIYRGPVSALQLRKDAESLDAHTSESATHPTPFSGKWFARPTHLAPRRIAKTLFESGHLSESEDYLRQLTSWYDRQRNDAIGGGADQGEFADVQKFLAALLVEQQRHDEAIIPLGRYLSIVRDDSLGHVVMAEALVKLKRPKEALEHFEKALEFSLGNADVLTKMADLKLRMGLAAEAATAYRRSLTLRPNAKTHFALANALVVQGDAADAIEQFREALQIDPNMLPAANNLAWILATWHDPAQRNGEEAVRLAEKMCQLAKHPPPSMLSTLAASYAEAGRFAEAVSTLEKAIQLATKLNETKLLLQWKEQLVQYKEGEAHRMAPRDK